jgi:hypothetical protein
MKSTSIQKVGMEIQLQTRNLLYKTRLTSDAQEVRSKYWKIVNLSVVNHCAGRLSYLILYSSISRTQVLFPCVHVCSEQKYGHSPTLLNVHLIILLV